MLLNFDNKENASLFPNALGYREIEGEVGRVTVYREILMMQAMNSITEKPEWHRKVHMYN